MSNTRRRLLGLKDLVCDAIEGTTHLVEQAQDSVADAALDVLEPTAAAGTARVANQARRIGTRAVLSSVRAVTQVVRVAVDQGARLADDEAPGEPVQLASSSTLTVPYAVDAAIGALNGVIGDHLAERDNGLQIDLQLRIGDDVFSPGAKNELHEALGERLAIFVHGLSSTETSWMLFSQDNWGEPDQCYGRRLSEDLAYTPIYARYNSGRHISENGRALARLIQELVDQHPGTPSSIILVGHSMGGLVARSTCLYAEEENLPWLRQLHNVFCIGSPHLGNPMERAGHALTQALDAANLPIPAISVPLAIGKRRSAGIKDLRYGSLRDEDWEGPDPDARRPCDQSQVPYVDGVTYLFVGATVTRDTEHPLGQLVGDMIVRADSALHADGETVPDVEHTSFTLSRSTVGGLTHVHIQNHPAVYEQMRLWLADHP